MPAHTSTALADAALAHGTAALQHGTPHQQLSLRAVAEACGVTSPALLKHFGSTTGYLAGLAAGEWNTLHRALSRRPADAVARALAYVMWSTDHPRQFGLMYEPGLWSWQPAATVDTGRGDGLTARWREQMIAERDLCFEDIAAVVGTPRRRIDPALYARLIASLATGLAFEFVYEGLFADEASGAALRRLRERHALEILGIGAGDAR